MNRRKYMKQAEKFRTEKDAFIHAEMMNGTTELTVAGGTLALLHIIGCAVNRISEITGQSFDDVLQAVKMIRLEAMSNDTDR